MNSAQISKWPTSGWAELMKAIEKYAQNDESNVSVKLQ